VSDLQVTVPAQLARVHMVGIGGAGMSGLARILLARGGQVSGSDAKESRAVLELRARGAKVQVGHSPSALDLLEGGPTMVITTHAAIPKDNPELVAARERGIPVVLRPQVLAELMAGNRTLLVAGTHGKTSTTSMSVVALQTCGLDPSFAVGGELNESGTNAHHGHDSIFVAEADESDGSLLQFEPDVAIVTNVESDHLDFFGSEAAYVRVFDDFADRITTGGTLVICLDDEGSAALAGRVAERLQQRGVEVIGYGRGTHRAAAPTVPLVAELLEFRPRAAGGATSIRLSGVDDRLDGDHVLTLAVPGEHMALNAIAALLAGVRIGAPVDRVVTGIESFSGVRRRFQLRGTVGDIAVYDDYAHHPTEVRAVLTAARDLAGARGGRVIAIFQPHLYSRTATFAAEFGAALSLADHVIVLDVFGAREQPVPGISGQTIVDAVTTEVDYVPNVSRLPGRVAELARPHDVILTIGAGDITMQGEEILAALDDARSDDPAAQANPDGAHGA
jgi:UDP-N-acetylmuramate--alanine ligase